jgi:hypothetical protein
VTGGAPSRGDARAVDPGIEASELAGRVRLTLRGLAQAEGSTLREAADDLVRRVLLIAMAFRASGIGPVSSECVLDIRLLDFVFELGEIAARGGDIRSRLFGTACAP